MAKPRVYEQSAVIAKTAELFARHGYRNITMQLLADELGIAKPTLYVHGHSKQELLTAVNIRFLERVEECLKIARAERIAGNQIRKLVYLWVDLYVQEWPSIRVYHAEHKELPISTRNIMKTRAAKIVTTLTSMITKAQTSGDINPHVPARYIVWVFVGTINWMPRWYHSESWSPQQIGDYLSSMLFLKSD